MTRLNPACLNPECFASAEGLSGYCRACGGLVARTMAKGIVLGGAIVGLIAWLTGLA